MLRIGGGQKVVLRPKESGFSRHLFFGLVLALGFHLLLFFGLRVTSGPSPDFLLPLSPVSVEIDLGKPVNRVKIPSSVTFWPMERLEPPPLLEMPPPQLIVEFHKPCTKEPDFSDAERIEYQILEDLEEDD